MTKYKQLETKIKERYPHAKIKNKKDHWFWKRMPKPLRTSAITLPGTIWVPEENFEVLSHEYQHLVDFEEMGYANAMLMYLSPQIFFVFWLWFAFMALCFSLPVFGVVFSIIALLHLLPWPSKGRMYFETKGYQMTLFVAYHSKQDMFRYSNFVIDALTSWLYYKMVWSKQEAANVVLDVQEEITQSTAATHGVAFQDVYEIIKANN